MSVAVVLMAILTTTTQQVADCVSLSQRATKFKADFRISLLAKLTAIAHEHAVQRLENKPIQQAA